ncbi:MAG: SRPBCC family protein [Cyclobacteriaceae bacterium]
MKYTLDIDIDLPRDRVIELFDSTENLKKWQPELVSFEHISGEPGQKGAKSKMLYKMGKREVEMIETITKRNFPDAFNGTYEAKGVMNWANNTFEEVNSNKTKWISENEFQFGGFMKLIGFFMKSSFPKQTFKYMEQFKAFAENET